MTVIDATAREDVLDWLRLTLTPGLSCGAQRALLRTLGSPGSVLSASPAALAGAADARAVAALARGADAKLIDQSLCWLAGEGRYLVALGDAHYPRALLEITDPPTVLYVQGRPELLNVPAIAVVGSRNATAQGLRDAEAFARALSDAGVLVVSGLALGIDAAAHRGGLAGRSSSLGVMGTGPERIYPARNRALGEDLATRGAVITEFPIGTPPAADNFPRRNRLISGLARGVLVVEAAPESGSLITARCALEQGRDVFAIPGSIHSPLSKGPHVLIKQGAKLVECVDDVLTEIGFAEADAAAKSPRRAPEDDPLLGALGFAPASIDQLAARTGPAAARIAARLAELEIEGRVASLAGGMFQRLSAP